MTNIISRIFSKKKPEQKAVDAPTIPLPKGKLKEKTSAEKDVISLELPQLVIGCAQSVGALREHNEDALFALTTNLAGNGISNPVGVYLVADGMGGHKLGEVASGLAIRTIANHITREIILPLVAAKPTIPSESIQEILQTSIREAHETILKEAQGSGTTLTAVLVLERQMTIAHVGDSRVYFIAEDGFIEPLTRDHSLVGRMIELGQLTEAEAAVHPQRNVLYRAVGQGEPFAADIQTTPLPASGHILLCTDGLWGVVSKEEIARVVTTAPDPQIACQMLVNAANALGGPDNISAILIRVPHQAR